MFQSGNHLSRISILLIFAVYITSCGSKKSETPKTPKRTEVSEVFEKYWSIGKAEITTYDLLQARNGELHHGEAVLIFSKEHFSRSRQMMTEQQEKKKGDVIDILKMVQSRQFNSGLESHSVMNSVYTPVSLHDGPYALKVMCSLQEWEGQTFSQLNLDANKYLLQLRSYLETKGDQNRVVLLTIPEDQIWSIIRINPGDLPIGNLQLIPGLISQSFRNNDIEAKSAESTLTDANPSELGGFENMRKYSIKYIKDDRLLEIFFNNSSPYEIYGWKETYKDGSGLKSKKLTSVAIRKNAVFTDLRNESQEQKIILRKSLKFQEWSQGDTIHIK